MTNIKHYIDDDESGRFFDRSAYVQMMDDVENGKVGIVIMKDMTRWEGATISKWGTRWKYSAETTCGLSQSITA